MKNKKLLLLFLGLLIIFGFLVRFFKLSELFYFMFDEQRDAFIIKKILIDKKPTLIGGSVPGGIYLGPLYFYISAVIYFFSKMNPLGGAVFASSLGVFLVFFIYIVGKKLFSQQTAFFAAVFYSLSTLIIIYNRNYWPLVFAPLVSLTTYFCLYQIIIKKKLNYVYLLSLALILGAQSDPSNLSLIVLTVIFWIIFRLPVKKKKVLISIGLFFTSHLPLVLFDLRHNFLNLKAFLNLVNPFLSKSIEFSLPLKGMLLIPKTLSRTIFLTGVSDIVKQILPCEQYLVEREQIPIILALFSSLLLMFFLYQSFIKKSFGLKIISTHLLIIVLGIFLYNIFFPGYTHEWFLSVFFPGFCFILGYSFSQLFIHQKTKFFTILFIFMFGLINIKNTLNLQNSSSFKSKTKAISFALSQVKGEEFFLDSIGGCFGHGGYRYLFWLQGNEPTHSYVDAVFGNWLYKMPQKSRPFLGVVIVNPADVERGDFYQTYLNYLKKTVSRKRFGKIEVLIVEDQPFFTLVSPF